MAIFYLSALSKKGFWKYMFVKAEIIQFGIYKTVIANRVEQVKWKKEN